MSDNQIIRFRIIDKCIRNLNHRYYIDDPHNEGIPNLLDECNRILREKDLPTVSRRTIHDDIHHIEEIYETVIDSIRDGKRTYYRYADPTFSIERIPLTDDEIAKLQDTVLMLNRFRGLPQFDWMEELLAELQTKFHIDGHSDNVIGFESNIYSEGLKHLEPLFQYIINKQAITLTYRPFNKSELKWLLHPYYIKQHNNRWFLFALNNDGRAISTIPLDRIISIQPARIKYIPNTEIDFSEYFDDVIGVTIPDAPIEKVLLKFTPQRFPYVISKALHGTQRIKDKEQCIVEIDVIPNKELVSELLWYGEDVEVLEPASLRQEIHKRIEKMHQLYL